MKTIKPNWVDINDEECIWELSPDLNFKVYLSGLNDCGDIYRITANYSKNLFAASIEEIIDYMVYDDDGYTKKETAKDAVESMVYTLINPVDFLVEKADKESREIKTISPEWVIDTKRNKYTWQIQNILTFVIIQHHDYRDGIDYYVLHTVYHQTKDKHTNLFLDAVSELVYKDFKFECLLYAQNKAEEVLTIMLNPPKVLLDIVKEPQCDIF